MLAPAANQLNFWPFDGTLPDLLKKPGITVVEIYPKEAYKHLNVLIGAGTGMSKGNRENRKEASKHLYESNLDRIRISRAAESWFTSGFNSDDDFDAMMGLLSMLQIVTGQYDYSIPDDEIVHDIEGWILGLNY